MVWEKRQMHGTVGRSERTVFLKEAGHGARMKDEGSKVNYEV